MVGWHHQIIGHEFEQASGVGDGQGSLACCSLWGCKESDTTEQLNWTELNMRVHKCRVTAFRNSCILDIWLTRETGSTTGIYSRELVTGDGGAKTAAEGSASKKPLPAPRLKGLTQPFQRLMNTSGTWWVCLGAGAMKETQLLPENESETDNKGKKRPH